MHLKTNNEIIVEMIPTIKSVKNKPASHFDDPDNLEITRKGGAKYHLIYNQSDNDIAKKWGEEQILDKISKIENIIEEVVEAINKLNSKSKIKFIGDSANTGYLGNEYKFSFQVNGESMTKGYYLNDKFTNSHIISEISSFYVDQLEGVITYTNGVCMINGVAIEKFMKNNVNTFCKITLKKKHL
jgi:hypothetical protein